MNVKRNLSRLGLALVLLVAASSMAFDLASKDIAANKTIGAEFIFNGMGCTGQNNSPELHWTGVPKEAKSLALTVYDPAAPTGSGFWHWVVYNIPVTATSLPKSWKSAGTGSIEVTNDYGMAQYGGPCPPPGKPHPYIFTLHALNTDKLEVPTGATNAVARFMIEGATVKKASFKAYYGK